MIGSSTRSIRRGGWLYGSAARREAREESDLDLLVVMPEAEDVPPRNRARAIRRLFRGWRVPMDIVVLEPEEFRAGQDQPGHVARIAIREGRRLDGWSTGRGPCLYGA